jgi:hypothetical protein
VYYYERFQIIPLMQNMTVEENIKLAVHSLGDLISTTPGIPQFGDYSQLFRKRNKFKQFWFFSSFSSKLLAQIFRKIEQIRFERWGALT